MVNISNIMLKLVFSGAEFLNCSCVGFTCRTLVSARLASNLLTFLCAFRSHRKWQIRRGRGRGKPLPPRRKSPSTLFHTFPFQSLPFLFLSLPFPSLPLSLCLSLSQSNAFYLSLTLTLVTSLLKVTLLFSLTLFAFSSI